MTLTNLDHIVVGAATLEQGIAYLEDLLGVRVPEGGEHPLMGTHNHLMQLGNEVFLEVIAINPDAPAPERPRWYGLDDPLLRSELERQPRLLTWVVNTGDIANLQSRTPFSFGKATPVSRGELSWHFGIPDDGRLLASGMLPYLIEWHTNEHPAKAMPDLGCRLIGLELYHPYPAWASAVLTSIGAERWVKMHMLGPNQAPYLSIQLDTPKGLIVLDSQPL